MEKQSQIIITDTTQLKERVITFFKDYGFRLSNEKDDILKFKQKSTILEAWQTNPLRWGSKISVTIQGEIVFAIFSVDTDGQMNTPDEENVWLNFIESFESYLAHGIIDKKGIALCIKTNKQNRIYYIAWAIVGAIAGAFLTFIYKKFVGDDFITMFFIPASAALFLSTSISFIKAKNAI